jgi:hypothetical protein
MFLIILTALATTAVAVLVAGLAASNGINVMFAVTMWCFVAGYAVSTFIELLNS